MLPQVFLVSQPRFYLWNKLKDIKLNTGKYMPFGYTQQNATLQITYHYELS